MPTRTSTGRPAIGQPATAPGMGNAQGALYNAYINKTPLIDCRKSATEYAEPNVLLTNVDATNVPKPFANGPPNRRSRLGSCGAGEGGFTSRTPRRGGSVFVSLPMDGMAVELTEKEASDVALSRTRTVTDVLMVFPTTLRRFAGRLNAAKSPAIVVGGDVERFGAWDAVDRARRRTLSVVFSAPSTGLSGFPEDHPLYQGTFAGRRVALRRSQAGMASSNGWRRRCSGYHPQIWLYLPDGTQPSTSRTIPTRPAACRGR